jgi:hypothetical protein
MLVMTVLVIATLGMGQALAQDNSKPDVTKGVYWADRETGTEVYLVPKSGQSYRLLVLSNKDVKVTYRTRINSVEPVTKELAPLDASGGVIRYYEFDHYFSKMTIWMGLEFTVDGKKVPALTRVFYDNIFQIAPGNMYLGPKN